MTHPALLLKELETRARKRLGQNFLVDPAISESIVRVAGVGQGSRVLEVGPGLGSLTQALLAAGCQVVAVEKDPLLASFIRERIPEVRMVEGDALDLDPQILCPGGGWHAVANLPYNVATMILMRFVELPDTFRSLTLMLQREVAERLAAGPGSRTYGALSVEVQACAEVRIVMRLPPGAFHPRPKVESSVVHFSLLPERRSGGATARMFKDVVRASFSQRRKMLRNSLCAGFGRERTEAALLLARILPSVRAEELSLEDFGRLAVAMEGLSPT